MTHIGIDARLLHYRSSGGTSTYIRQLIKSLEKSASEHDFLLFQSRKSQKHISDIFQAHKLWTPPHHRLERFALSAELARYRLDILHSPDFIPPLQGAKKHLITVHDLNFLHYPDYLTADSRRYYNDQIEMAVQHADHILVVSEATKQDLINLLHVPSEKITVQPHGVDAQFRPMTPAEISPTLKKLNLPEQYFLHVGTLEPRKNIIGLLTAYKKLLQKIPDAPPVVLVGRSGWLFDETEKQIQALDMDEHILWRKNVSDEQLPAVYNGALALITPSFYEGFGMPALEAMACGTAPIVSNISALPEVVGDVGLLIDPHEIDSITEALHQVLIDTDWRQSEQEKALQRAKQFTWANSARIALEVYDLLS